MSTTEWHELRTDMWLRNAPHGFVSIDKIKADDDYAEYWVQTLGDDFCPEGPRATSEVFPDLIFAKEDGEKCAKAWTEGAEPAWRLISAGLRRDTSDGYVLITREDDEFKARGFNVDGSASDRFKDIAGLTLIGTANAVNEWLEETTPPILRR